MCAVRAPVRLADRRATSRQTCGGLGVVACVNCKGEGVTVPIALQRKEIDMPMDEFEAALEEMGIAALAANYVNAQVEQKTKTYVNAQVGKPVNLIERSGMPNPLKLRERPFRKTRKPTSISS
jgi:hypothetical protein